MNAVEPKIGPEGLAAVRRKWKNWLLAPKLQTQLAVYSILVSIMFAVTIVVIIYAKFSDLASSILVLTDLPEEVTEIVNANWQESQVFVYSACLLYLICMVVLSIWYTHRLIGPTIAFRRHILSLVAGKYYARTNLRSGDAFAEVAEALNTLSEALQEKEVEAKKQNS